MLSEVEASVFHRITAFDAVYSELAEGLRLTILKLFPQNLSENLIFKYYEKITV